MTKCQELPGALPPGPLRGPCPEPARGPTAPPDPQLFWQWSLTIPCAPLARHGKAKLPHGLAFIIFPPY